MIKTNLPVLLIRNMVLFPNSEVRIEIDSEIDKKVISLAEDYYDNQVLIVNPKDVLDSMVNDNTGSSSENSGEDVPVVDENGDNTPQVSTPSE